MSRGVNKAIIIGTLGADPVVRYSQGGAAVCNLSAATNESWKDKTTGEQQERTEWHRITMFGKLAEIAGEYLKKGSTAYFEGKLRTEKYTDKDGIERYQTSIVADEMQMLGGKEGRGQGPAREAGPAKAQQGKPPARAQQAAPPPQDDFEDSIPF